MTVHEVFEFTVSLHVHAYYSIWPSNKITMGFTLLSIVVCTCSKEPAGVGESHLHGAALQPALTVELNLRQLNEPEERGATIPYNVCGAIFNRCP